MTTFPKLQQTPRFTLIDLFAGIGGLRRGFEPIGGRCFFTSKIDHFCRETYPADFDCGHDVAGDIAMIPASAIPAQDVLLAGFPISRSRSPVSPRGTP